MPDPVARLLNHLHAEAGPPANPASLARLRERVGCGLPEPLVRLWQTAGTVLFVTLDAELLGPDQIIELLVPGLNEVFLDRGYLPVLDDHESNYATVAVRPPLAPRVAWLAHGSDHHVLFRSVDGFLNALADALDGERSASSVFHGTQGDYLDDGPRTEEDRQAGRERLAAGTQEGRWEATQLLAAADLSEWSAVLDTDHMVRCGVQDRLRRMSNPDDVELLVRDRAAFESFVNEVTAAAMVAGVKIGRRDGDNMRISGNWFALDGFYHRRRIPGALPRLIAFVQDVAAGRDPRARPDHFFADQHG